MSTKFTRLGGLLTLGATPLDVSSQVVGVTVNSEVDTGDSITVLSGESIASGLSSSGRDPFGFGQSRVQRALGI